jgi:hypothetical protein
VVLLHQQRLVASSDDPNDTPGYNATHMSSLKDNKTWEGNTGDMIAMSIHYSGSRPHARQGEAGPNGGMRDEPVNEPVGLTARRMSWTMATSISSGTTTAAAHHAVEFHLNPCNI